MNILIALLLWLLQTSQPAAIGYGAHMVAAPGLADKPTVIEVESQHKPPESTPPDWSTCMAIGCTDPEPPFTRVPGRRGDGEQRPSEPCTGDVRGHVQKPVGYEGVWCGE